MSTVDQLIASAGHKVVEQGEPAGEPVIEVAAEIVPDIIPEPTKPDAPVVDRFKILGETFGREFATDDDLTAFKSSLTDNETKLKDYENRYAALEKTNQDLSASIDPRSYFATDQLFTLNGLMKKFPGKHVGALTEISTKDFTKAHIETPMDVLALELMMEHPEIYTNKADAEEDIRAKFDIVGQDDDDNWVIDPAAKRRMQVEAQVAIGKFDAIKAQIEQPKLVDPPEVKAQKELSEQTRIQKMTEATAPLFSKMIPDALKEVEFPITVTDENGKEVTEIAFKYEIGDGYAKSKSVQDILNSLRETTIKEGTEWTPAKETQMKDELTALLKGSYMFHNREKIYAAMSEDLMTKFKDANWMKRHNARPLRQDGTVPKLNDKAAKLDAQQNDFFKSQGIKV